MSKLRKVGLVLAPVACLALAAAGAGAVQAKGDVNDDGAVDQLDVMLLQKHLIGAITLAPGAGGPQDAANVAPFVPDVTVGDGALDVADLAVLAHAIGEADLDGDGLAADFENEAGSSPLDPTSDGSTPDGELDPDADGLGHADELAEGTDPFDADSDDDGLLDGFEVVNGFDPLAAGEEDDDPDGDGSDNLDEQAQGTDPNRADTDYDAVLDGADACPLDEYNDEDADGLCRNEDNCPVNPNASQADGDADGIGDACDRCPAAPGSDPDLDAVCGAADNCPEWPNDLQEDTNGDGIGDECQCGDVTGDGYVTGADVAAFEDAFYPVPPAEGDLSAIVQPRRCDVNGDGVCGPDDKLHLEDALAFPPGDVRATCPTLAEVRDKALGRLGYGPDAWSRERIVEVLPIEYVDQQLHPETIADPVIAQKLVPYVSGRYPTWGKTTSQLVAEYCNMNPTTCPTPTGIPEQVTANLSEIKFLHMVHSRRQLETVMLDFWVNHFNVDGGQETAVWGMQHFEQTAIRPNAFGKFEDLVLAVTKAPAMLEYLDLNQNRAGALNENYARELMELHTVGPVGTYDEDDVKAVAKVLTGYRYTAPSYQFVYNANQHDNSVKTVTFEEGGQVTDTWTFNGSLGCDGQPASAFENEGHVLICLLARHPKTAERISRKLLQRFVSETPDQATVDEIKAVWLATDGDLRAVIDAILNGDAFDRSLYLDQKVKRPSVYAASLVRLLGPGSEGTSNITVFPGAGGTRWRDSFHGIMGDLQTGGEYLHRAGPPTGYSEESRAWSGVGGILMRANQAARIVSRLPSTAVLGVAAGATHAEIVDQLAESLLAGRLSPEDRAALEDFLDTLPGTPTDDQKVRAAAAVLLSSTGFLAH